MEITEQNAVKVLEVVDAGLCKGKGQPIPGKMCVEAAVCYAFGWPHGDEPKCVAPSLRSLKISLNDCDWSSDRARAIGLRRIAVAQLGTSGTLDEKEFLSKVVEMTIRRILPRALRSAAKLNKTHKNSLLNAAKRCEIEGTKDAADAAYAAAAAAADAAYAAAAAADASYADASYAAYAAADAAAAYAAGAGDYAAAAGAYAAYAAGAGAAGAAGAAAYAAKKLAKDKELSFFAEEVVQILIEMKTPGSAFLYLTEQK